MKKLLTFPMLFAFYLCIGQAVDSASIIGKSIRIGNLEVAQHDFPRDMDWYEAERGYKFLKGWRLPTKEELDILYQYKNKIGGFAANVYWSSSEEGYGFFSAWDQDFANGNQVLIRKSNIRYVRVVRAF